MNQKKKQKKKKRKKKKLTAEQKLKRRLAKKERQKKYRWIFIDGKQVRVKREPTIDGIPVDDWLRKNADPVWLVQNEMFELLDADSGTIDFTSP